MKRKKKSILLITSAFWFGCLFEEKEELCPDAEQPGIGKIAEVNLTGKMAHRAHSKIMAGAQNIFPESTLAKADSAWIIDGNQDGRGDSIFIKFAKPLTTPPESVISIDWPAEGEPNRTARLKSNEIILSGDGSSVILVLRGVLDTTANVFPLNKTAADNKSPPFLTLPQDAIFQGQSVPIHDGMGAVVVRATKIPSNNNYYKDLDGEYQRNPDTLMITLSEKLRALPNTASPWDSLFRFFPPGGNRETSNALMPMTGAQPLPPDLDSLTWIFPVSNVPAAHPNLGDWIYPDPGAPWVDGSSKANPPSGALRQIDGDEPKVEIFRTGISDQIVGDALPSSQSFIRFSSRFRKIDSITGKVINYWIEPAYLEPDGTIDEKKQENCSDTVDNRGLSIYPENCLSTITVTSYTQYTAQIKIYNTDGNLVHRSVQRFGFCGELQNTNRANPGGAVSWLVWNMRDLEGDFVGTGIYSWDVRFDEPDDSFTNLYKQAIACIHAKPKQYCAKTKLVSAVSAQQSAPSPKP